MSRAGVRPDIAERVLGHIIPGVEGVYDRHHYTEEKAPRSAGSGGADRQDLEASGNQGASAQGLGISKSYPCAFHNLWWESKPSVHTCCGDARDMRIFQSWNKP